MWKEIIVVGMIEVVVVVVYDEVEEVGMLMPMKKGLFMMDVGVVEEVTNDWTGELRIPNQGDTRGKHLHQE